MLPSEHLRKRPLKAPAFLLDLLQRILSNAHDLRLIRLLDLSAKVLHHPQREPHLSDELSFPTNQWHMSAARLRSSMLGFEHVGPRWRILEGLLCRRDIQDHGLLRQVTRLRLAGRRRVASKQRQTGQNGYSQKYDLISNICEQRQTQLRSRPNRLPMGTACLSECDISYS